MTESMLLIGVGTSGCRLAHRIQENFGGPVKAVFCDTDAVTGQDGGDFILLGGNQLSGRGAGGSIVDARMAVEESIEVLDPSLEGIRLAVVVACLGAGTGGGATLEIVKRLALRGIPSIVFATTPFAFEGENRLRNTRGITQMIQESANASFFLPLDEIATATDNLKESFAIAEERLARGIAFFWQLVEKPGYLRLDAERLRHVLAQAGRGRFACVEASGENRAAAIVDALKSNPTLNATGVPQTRAILIGILAGDDLRLTEIGTITSAARAQFGESAQFELATVNDEATLGGRIEVVTMLFEAGRDNALNRTRKVQSVLSQAPQGRGRFSNAEATLWNGENMDEPTYLRKNISLDF